MIRLAGVDEIPVITNMGMEFAKYYPFSFTPDREKVHAVVSDIVHRASSDGLAIVATDDDIPVGCLLAIAHEFIFNRERVATEIMWWVEPACRQSMIGLHLLKTFESWAKVNDCSLIQLTTVAAEYADRLSSVYARRGYTALEINYLKRA